MQEIRLYGLTGYPLSHSFSQAYFAEKFAKEGYGKYAYRNFPLKDISELHELLEREPRLCGFNVTRPYKEQIIPYLDETDAIARATGAVNTVQIVHRKNRAPHMKGYNTDVYGFSRSLQEWFARHGATLPHQALVLGSGGAAKAVEYALHSLNIIAHRVSRSENSGAYRTYAQLTGNDIAEHRLIIHTTPLGTYPDTEQCVPIPCSSLTREHWMYDLVYNPPETRFMRTGAEKGARTCNGLRMLHLQADHAWEIWNRQ